MRELGQINISKTPLGYDAWNRAKTVQDYSLFSALWTYSVPNRLWVEFLDTAGTYVEQSVIDNTLVRSTKNHLEITGTSTTNTMLLSKRHPRYQANRGFLYSSAGFIPSPTLTGIRRFGAAVDGVTGVFFELVGNGANWVMNFVRRTTVLGVTTDTRTDITSEIQAVLPSFNPAKGNTYDIQMQWRGVGNMFVYVNQKLVHTEELLAALDDISLNNPALQVYFECTDAGAEDISMYFGCVDITTEGGARANKLYTSITTGSALLPTTNVGVALIAIKIPSTITYDGGLVPYTRDMIMTELTSFCKDESQISVYYGRLVVATNLDAAAGWVKKSDSEFLYLTNASGALDTAFQLDKGSLDLIYSTRVEIDTSLSHRNPDPNNADFFLTAGDIVVVELTSDNSSTGGVTLEFAEEV